MIDDTEMVSQTWGKYFDNVFKFYWLEATKEQISADLKVFNLSSRVISFDIGKVKLGKIQSGKIIQNDLSKIFK